MTRKKTDTPVTPLRPQAPVTAAELRTALTPLAHAEVIALETLSRVLGECPPQPPGISAWSSTFALDDERGGLARDLLTHLEPALTRHARGA
jgi:hypothetical protein